MKTKINVAPVADLTWATTAASVWRRDGVTAWRCDGVTTHRVAALQATASVRAGQRRGMEWRTRPRDSTGAFLWQCVSGLNKDNFSYLRVSGAEDDHSILLKKITIIWHPGHWFNTLNFIPQRSKTEGRYPRQNWWDLFIRIWNNYLWRATGLHFRSTAFSFVYLLSKYMDTLKTCLTRGWHVFDYYQHRRKIFSVPRLVYWQ